MSNPTTPFNWQMPTSVDLVTDLPADFEVFGQAVATSMADLLGGTTGQILTKASNTDMDFTWSASNPGDITGVTAGTGISGGGTSGNVTITNDMATTITASGDILVGTGSGTYDNLPIGTTGQLLTADTTVSPYKVKWASPAASPSGLTLIQRTSFSNVAGTSTTFDGVFTSTYKSYLILIERIYSGTDSNDMQMQFLYSGTTQNTGYYGAVVRVDQGGTQTITGQGNASEMTIGNESGISYDPGAAQIFVNKVGNTNENGIIRGQYMEGANANGYSFNIKSNNSQTYTGFLLKSSSTNITGTVAVYGLAI